MKFHLDPEQVAIQETVYGALTDALPREKLMAFLDEDADFEPRSWQAVMALGLGGLMLPEEAGGSGLKLLDAALAIEALGKAAAPGPIMGQLLAGLALNLSTNWAAKSKWLDKIASGDAIAAFAFDGTPDKWTVEVSGDQATGSVGFVIGGRAADFFLVGTKGGGLAIVECGDGVKVEPVQSTDRTRKLTHLTLDGTKVQILFEPGDQGAAKVYDAALILIAADCLGGAGYCMDLSVSYAQERKQFGQPVARFQALKHQLATMALGVEPARSLLWYAAYAWDAELPDVSRSAAIAKAHLCDRYTQITRDAIAAHGGIGYTWEYGLNIWFRRSVLNRALLGSPQVHRARAAELAGW